MRKNNKGFTLIELLAVIVVLAIIMVIATQQVNSTIKKSRANTYADSVMSIKKGLQTVCATSSTGKITQEDINNTIDFSDVKIKMTSGASQATITPSTNSKYSNMDLGTLKDALTDKSNISITMSGSNVTSTVTITTDCPAGEEIDL